jgi:hypothetical protein
MVDATDAVSAVKNLVAAARRLVDDREQLALELAESSGLSPEGVLLALDKHLEWRASDAEIAELVRQAAPAAPPSTGDGVCVVLSANVFTAALRAVALARAASTCVLVRPSSREPVFVRELLARAADPAITIVDRIPSERFGGQGRGRVGEVHAYGRDETIAAIRARLPPDVRLRAHGAGFGVAVIAGDALDDTAARLADDVVAFDQKGCLSPRVAFVVGGEDGRPAARRAQVFAERLARALDALGVSVPRGRLEAEERAAITRYVETMRTVGAVEAGASFVVAVAEPNSPMLLPPIGRVVHVLPVDHAAVAGNLLSPLEPWLVAVGEDVPGAADGIAPPHARRSGVGFMQRPRFDGPVDRRGG